MQVYIARAGLIAQGAIQDNHGHKALEFTAENRHWEFEFKKACKDQNSEAKLQEDINQIVTKDYVNSTEFQELRKVSMVFSLSNRKFGKWAGL